MLKGTDAVVFHQIAMEKARLININGWSFWELRPSGHSPAGIASIFYALLTPKPFVLIPILSAFHAGSALLLVYILKMIFDNISISVILIAIIPFLIFPSAISWNAQIHRDGFFIFGNFLFLCTWLYTIKGKEREHRLSLIKLVYFGIGLFFSFFFVWLSRTYWITYLILFSIICIGNLIIVEIKTLLHTKNGRAGIAFNLTLLSTFVFIIGGAFFSLDNNKNGILDEMANTGNENFDNEKIQWEHLVWIPYFADIQFQKLANFRRGFIHYSMMVHSGTDIDTDILFGNAIDILLYLPRALYLGLFMPTTKYTFKNGHSPGGTLMRFVTGVEMFFVYLTYPFLFFAIHQSKQKNLLLLVLFWSLGAITVFAVVTTNIGTLYRFRYGFLMTVSCIGTLQAITLIRKIIIENGLRE